MHMHIGVVTVMAAVLAIVFLVYRISTHARRKRAYEKYLSAACELAAWKSANRYSRDAEERRRLLIQLFDAYSAFIGLRVKIRPCDKKYLIELETEVKKFDQDRHIDGADFWKS